MISRLNNRERLLLWIVGGIIAVLLNLFLVNFFTKNYKRLQSDFSLKQSELAALRSLSGDRPLWEQREAWLEEKQPRLENEATAGVQLLDQVKELARKSEVLIEQPTIGTLDRTRAERVAVPVTFDTKSSWKALGKFLIDLQAPGQFIVIESASLRIDGQDQTQMRAKFRIAKWFAPK